MLSSPNCTPFHQSRLRSARGTAGGPLGQQTVLWPEHRAPASSQPDMQAPRSPGRITPPGCAQPPPLGEPQLNQSAGHAGALTPGRTTPPGHAQPPPLREPRLDQRAGHTGALTPGRTTPPGRAQPPPLEEPRLNQSAGHAGALTPGRTTPLAVPGPAPPGAPA